MRLWAQFFLKIFIDISLRANESSRVRNMNPQLEIPMKLKNSLKELFRRTMVSACALAVITILGTTQTQAADGSWNVDASGDWATGSNWLGGVIPGAASNFNPDVATFGIPLSADRAVNVDSGRGFHGITFTGTSAFKYTFTSLGSVNLSDGGVILSNATSGNRMDLVNLQFNIRGATAGSSATAHFTNNSASGVVLSISNVRGASNTGNVTTIFLDGTNTNGNQVSGLIKDTVSTSGGKVAVVKNDSGAWRLRNTTGNTYSGGTTLNAGTLGFDSFANIFGTGTISINGGTLNQASNGVVTYANEIAVGGNFSYQGVGTVGNTITFSGNMNLGGAARTITTTIGNSTVAFSGAISNGSLVKDGVFGSTMILSGTNTYTGSTTVTAGTLLINGDNSAATGAVAVNNGATLGGSGIVGGATTIGANATLAPGNSPGLLLAFSNSLTFSDPAAKAIFEIASGSRGTNYDAVNVGSLLTYGGDLTLTMTAAIADGTYNLFDFGTQTGDFDTIAFGGGSNPYSGSFAFGSGIWTASSVGQLFTFTQSTGDLTVSAVPEPTVSILIGLSLMALTLRRRRVA